MTGAFDDIVGYAGQYTVAHNEIDEKMSELLGVIPTTIVAIPDSPQEYKVDFFLLHIINALIFLPTILRQTWMTPEAKARLVEWFGRYCILTYASANSPDLSTERLESYKLENLRSWGELISRSVNLEVDDGHLSKLVRVLMFAEKMAMQKAGKGETPLVREGLWLKLANVANDSIHDDEIESPQ
ncbi:hypothetical protein LTR93_012304, partial [Exophiala xenobiotica]